MPEDMQKIPNILQRALGVMRSRKLRRWKGSDPSEIERKVTEYYASCSGAEYYSHLASQDLWADTARRKDFKVLCQSSADILDFGCGAGGLALAILALLTMVGISASLARSGKQLLSL